jgi:hypothetical protein
VPARNGLRALLDSGETVVASQSAPTLSISRCVCGQSVENPFNVLALALTITSRVSPGRARTPARGSRRGEIRPGFDFSLYTCDSSDAATSVIVSANAHDPGGTESGASLFFPVIKRDL